MHKGYKKGMLSLFDIQNAAMLFENSTPQKTLNELLVAATSIKNPLKQKQSLDNIDFLLRISDCILSNENNAAYLAVRVYLDKFIEKNFHPGYSYNWQELKSILFYCNYMSKLKNFSEFASKLKNPHFNSRLSGYLLQDAALPSRKHIAMQVVTMNTLQIPQTSHLTAGTNQYALMLKTQS